VPGSFSPEASLHLRSEATPVLDLDAPCGSFLASSASGLNPSGVLPGNSQQADGPQVEDLADLEGQGIKQEGKAKIRSSHTDKEAAKSRTHQDHTGNCYLSGSSSTAACQHLGIRANSRNLDAPCGDFLVSSASGQGSLGALPLNSQLADMSQVIDLACLEERVIQEQDPRIGSGARQLIRVKSWSGPIFYRAPTLTHEKLEPQIRNRSLGTRQADINIEPLRPVTMVDHIKTSKYVKQHRIPQKQINKTISRGHQIKIPGALSISGVDGLRICVSCSASLQESEEHSSRDQFESLLLWRGDGCLQRSLNCSGSPPLRPAQGPDLDWLCCQVKGQDRLQPRSTISHRL
jgi:hypothetical protein